MAIITSTDLTDLKQFLKKLRKNLVVLQERKAKYADSAPLALLNQIDDYNKAIDLTKDTLIGDLEAEDLEEALKPLILELNSSTSQQAALKIPPPPASLNPPEVRDFIGREEELTYFIAKLKKTNLALITGMIGCGKTALAVTLAEIWQIKQLMNLSNASAISPSVESLEQIRKKTFWYKFNPDGGILPLVYALAGFLYYDGQPALWEMLETARLTNASPPEATNLFDYVFQMIKNKGYLLCLDDVQFIHRDNLLNLFVDRLRDALNKNELHLIFTAWEKPIYITQPYKPITGLNQTDTIHLLKNRGLTLNNELSTEVYRLTEGNAKLLDLTILVLLKAKYPDRTLKNLAQSDDIERFLLKQVDTSLNELERDTLIATSVLLGYPADRTTIEEVSGHRRLKRTILALSDRYLLIVHDDYDDDLEEELYGTHTIIRNFYYDFPSRRELNKLHTLAAEIYQEEEDFIKAARHYEHAEQYQTAVDLLTEYFWPLMNKGEGEALQNLLKRLLKQNLTTIQTIKTNLALADIYRKAADLIIAEEHYQQCLKLLNVLAPSIDKQLLIARACRGMAEIIWVNDINKSLQWLEQGLTALEEANPEEKINLLLLKSQLQLLLANYQTAQQITEQALQHIPPHRDWLRIKGLKLLSTSYWYLDDKKQAVQLISQALNLADYHHDYFEKVNILNTLGIYKKVNGDLINATNIYQQALALAEDLGMIANQLNLKGNLGNLLIILGEYDKAEYYLLSQLKIAEERKMKRYNTIAKINLGQLYVKQAQFDKACNYLKDLLTTTSKVGLNDWIPHIYCYLTLIDLAKNKITSALQHANNALKMACEFKLSTEEGMAWCKLGQVHLANQDPPAALQAFAKSLALLADKNPYEQAHTQLEWGRYLISTPQLEQGQHLLQAARDTFKKMGAKVDLATVEELLKTLE